MHLVQQHLDLETTAAPLIKAAIARCQEKYGSAGPVFERGSSCDSRWLVARLAAFDSMGWIEELVVWCAEHGVTLSGGRGLAGAAFNDVAIVDLAHSDADRLILQRAAHEVYVW